MSRLEDLEAFIHIAESGSLTRAATRLNRSLQAVSRSLTSLEVDVGLQLVHRTTRHSALSEAGQAFYRRVKPAVLEIREAQLEAAGRRTGPSGILRVGAPMLFGPDFLVPIVAEYIESYPQAEVDLSLTDAFVDLASEGIDVVVRIADLPDSNLQSKRLGALRRVVFGAPSYFARNGRQNILRNCASTPASSEQSATDRGSGPSKLMERGGWLESGVRFAPMQWQRFILL